LFSAPMTDVSVQSCQFERLHSTLNANEPYGKIVFDYNGGGGSYIDLYSSYLYIRGKVVKADGTNLVLANNVGLTNVFLHSIFSDVKVLFNGKVVDDAGFNYPYISYNKILLGNGEGTKTTELTSQLYYKDDVPSSTGTNNKGYTKRKGIYKTSSVFELSGKLMLDIFDQKWYLPNGIDIQIVLTKASPEFFLWLPEDPAAGSGIPYKFQFEECAFVLKKLNINPSLVSKTEAQLKKGMKLKYPLKKTSIRTYNVAQGSFQFQSDHLTGGRLPERLYVCFVDSDAYVGKFSKNPFNYQHKDLETLTTFIEENINYTNSLTVDFTTHKYLEGYTRLFNLVHEGQDGNGLTRDDYASDGFSVFACDILCPTTLNAMLPQKPGQVKICAKFRSALTGPTTVIVMYTYASLLEVDDKRNVKIVF
jgi:hypothetical protein